MILHDFTYEFTMPDGTLNSVIFKYPDSGFLYIHDTDREFYQYTIRSNVPHCVDAVALRQLAAHLNRDPGSIFSDIYFDVLYRRDTNLSKLGRVIFRKERYSLSNRFYPLIDFRIKTSNGCETFAATNASLNNQKQQNEKENKQYNINTYIKLFAFGPNNKHLPLLCGMNTMPIELHDPIDGELCFDLELHHILNINRVSIHKNGMEPSKLLGTNLKYYCHIFELMICVPMTSLGHKKVHTKFTNGHDISLLKHKWKKWPSDKTPPSFIFESEENYNIVCNELEKYGFTGFKSMYPYSKFLEAISFRNEEEKTFCESEIKRIEPDYQA